MTRADLMSTCKYDRNTQAMVKVPGIGPMHPNNEEGDVEEEAHEGENEEMEEMGASRLGLKPKNNAAGTPV